MTTRFPSSTPATRPLAAAAPHDLPTSSAPLDGGPATVGESARRTTRGRLVRAWAALAVIAVAGLGVATLPVAASAAPGSDAAIPHRNEILHTRMAFSFLDASGARVRPPLTASRLDLPMLVARSASRLGFLSSDVDRWSAVGPLRERSAWTVSEEPEGPPLGTFEQSYAGGVLSSWESWIGDVSPSTLSDEERADYEALRLAGQRRWMVNVTFGADPIGGIRAMFDGGMLRSAGYVTVEGRRVLRLIGEEPGTEENGSPGAPIAHEYLVDPVSFAPVRVSTTWTTRGLIGSSGAKASLDEGFTLRWDVSEFEYLPLNEATQHLLVVGGGR